MCTTGENFVNAFNPCVDATLNSNMDTQEAAWFLLRQEISHKSHDAQFPTNCPHERVRVRKTKHEVPKLDPSSTYGWKQNVMQKYECTPNDMATECLADFMSKFWCNIRGGSHDGGTVHYVWRDQAIVIRYVNYSACKNVADYVRKQHRKYNRADDDEIVNELIEQYHRDHEKEDVSTPHRNHSAPAAVLDPYGEDDLLPTGELVKLPHKVACGRLKTQPPGYSYPDEPDSTPTSSDAEAAGAFEISRGFLRFIAMARGSSVTHCSSHHHRLCNFCEHHLGSVIIEDTRARRTSDVTLLSNTD
ncbi:hypothetical protein MRX96_020406 [Rhipicephalus microplus]